MSKEEMPEFDHANWQADPEDVKAPEGRRKTGSLFMETIQTPQLKKYGPLYTLSENPRWDNYWKRWVPSAKRIYVLSDDEYEAALKLVCSIEHWNRLLDLDWFVNGTKDYMWTSLTQWREEQRDRKRSMAESELMRKAQEGNVAAIKAILGESSQKRGRPSKEEIEGHKKIIARDKDVYDNDYERVIPFTVVRKDSGS